MLTCGERGFTIVGPTTHPEFYEEPPEELVERRLLTEVQHLIEGMRPDGSIDSEVLSGVFENLVTKVEEDVMPGAVTEVVQPLAEVTEENGVRRRTFIWKGLGRSALSVAKSGFDYYFSEAGFKRGHIEVREAVRSEDALTPGTAQSTIAPSMTEQDAPPEVAKRENLADTDSIRVATAVVDRDGNIIGRRTRSLLVRDIPLSAWVAMLRDPKNIFGKTFNITDEQSALSVMELFDQFDLPETDLPEGPVTLVEAVLSYLPSRLAKHSVKAQLREFRADQRRLHAESRAAAAELLDFEVELARSLHSKHATLEIERFMIGLQDEWDNETLALINSHSLPNGKYEMTETLAARLEQAKQKLIGRSAKIVIGSGDALKELGATKAAVIRREIEEVRLMVSMEYPAEEVARRQADLQRKMANIDIPTGGGCGGVNKFEFSKDRDSGDDGIQRLTGLETEQPIAENESNKSDTGKEKLGVCRTGGCPSDKKITRVGGCNVCLKWCQPIYDAGRDPAVIYKVAPASSADSVPTANRQQKAKPSEKSLTDRSFGNLALKTLDTTVGQKELVHA